MVVSAATWRNGGAMTKKKPKTRITPPTEPISGRFSARFQADCFPVRPAAAGIGTLRATVVTTCPDPPFRSTGDPPRSGQRVPAFAKAATTSMLSLVMKAGPVSTALPPPMTLPFARLSQSRSIAR